MYNTVWADRLLPTAEGRAFLSGLSDGSLGYESVMRYTAPLPFWAVMRFWRIVPEGPGSHRTFFSKIKRPDRGAEAIVHRARRVQGAMTNAQTADTAGTFASPEFGRRVSV